MIIGKLSEGNETVIDGQNARMTGQSRDAVSINQSILRTRLESLQRELIAIKIFSFQSNEKLSAEVDLKKLKSSASFREVRIITGGPSRDGDTVTIPTSTIRVLCDEPIQSSPLTFSVKDSE